MQKQLKDAYLHLFEVADSLDGLFALYCSGRVTWFQLDDGLGSSFQAFQVSFELSQLLFLILWRKRDSYVSKQLYLLTPVLKRLLLL